MLRDKNLLVNSNLVKTLVKKTAEEISGGAWMQFEDNGAWRQNDGGHGQYHNMWNIPLEACINNCLANQLCRGIEHNKPDHGQMLCEIHTEDLGYVEKVGVPGLKIRVYTKKE